MKPKSSALNPTVLSTSAVTRRNFIKTSALSAGALVFLSRGTALATGDGASGNSSLSGKIIEYQYRLMCVQAPEVDDGIIAWSEAENALAEPSTKQMRLDCSGPNIGENSQSYLTPIIATISSTLLDVIATSTSRPTLGIPKSNPPLDAKGKDLYDQYTGGWLASGAPQAVFYRDRELENLPVDAPAVTYNLVGEVATATLSHAGFKFDGMTVGQGVVSSSETTFSTTNTAEHSGEAAARAQLGVNVEGGVGASTDFIGKSVEIAANGSAGFEANGSLQKTEQFEKKDIGTVDERWESKVEFASAIGGAIKVTWIVIKQTQTRTRNYSDGFLLSTVISEWAPGPQSL